MASTVSELFDPELWREAPGFAELTDLTYPHDLEGRIARIAFNRPEVRNAFRPHTVDELYRSLDNARMNPRIASVFLTATAPTPATASCCSPATAPAHATEAGRSVRAATSASADGTATSTRMPRPESCRAP